MVKTKSLTCWIWCKSFHEGGYFGTKSQKYLYHKITRIDLVQVIIWPNVRLCRSTVSLTGGPSLHYEQIVLVSVPERAWSSPRLPHFSMWHYIWHKLINLTNLLVLIFHTKKLSILWQGHWHFAGTFCYFHYFMDLVLCVLYVHNAFKLNILYWIYSKPLSQNCSR